MPDQESIVLEVDPRSVLTAIKQANQAVEGWEKGTVGAGERMQKSLERMGEMLLKVNDRSRSSMERLTQSIEKQAAAYGKTEVERLIADRDRYIKKLGDEQGMVDRVTAAYNKMIEAAGKSGGSEIKQLGAEARESKASLALMPTHSPIPSRGARVRRRCGDRSGRLARRSSRSAAPISPAFSLRPPISTKCRYRSRRDSPDGPGTKTAIARPCLV